MQSRVKSITVGSSRLALFIFVFVLAIRLVALWRLTASPFLLPSRGDMYFYNDWSHRILQGQLTDHLAFYGLPLYAYLLASIYKLFGYSPFVPALLQALLEAGTATLIYKITTRVFTNERHGVIGGMAALGWAMFIPAQAYSVILMPTAGLVFVFWFLVWQVVRDEASPGRLRALLLGLLAGFTAMGVATILFVIPLLGGAILLRPAPSAKRKWLAMAMLFLGLGLGASPCWTHNYFVARDPVFLSAHSGINFWIGNNPLANGYPRFPPGLHAGQAAMLSDSIAVAEAVAGKPLKRSEVSAYWSAKASRYIHDEPSAWLRLVLVKLRNFWSAFQYDDLSIITNLREQGVIFAGIRFGLVAAFGLAGMFFAVVHFPASRWIAGAILLHMCSLLPVFVTERYRLPAAPGLMIFAAFGIWEFFESLAKMKYARTMSYLGLLALATAFVSIPQRNPALWALDAYNSGWQALESKNLALAQKKLELAYAYVPDNAEINLALGNLWLEEGDSSKAESFYRAALEMAPRHKSALNNLGVLALEQGRSQEALGLFRSALEIQRNDAKTHYLLARALLQIGERGEAFLEIQEALRLKPDQPEFVELSGRIRKEE